MSNNRVQKSPKPKIGVFLCDCGNEISRIINTQKINDSLSKENDVIVAEVHRHLCDSHTLKRLRRIVIDNQINSLVIGGCSPQLHLETFSKIFREANINLIGLKMVNIREHCSWVHKDKEKATDKAAALLNGAINKIKASKEIEVVETKVKKAALVIGAGVAGTNAALELAKKGIKTYLVEKNPWIGGVTAQVGMAFPTDDCAYCIGARSERSGIRKCFYRAGLESYPNLEIMTNTTVKSVEGKVGDFRVTIEEYPTFINEDCVSCGICEEVCPIEAPDTFNRGLSKRKAIYKQFEAVPNKYIIDFDACNVCKKCEEVCPEKAIDFSQRPKKHELEVGAIVVATGISEFDPSALTRYGYKKYPQVLTQLDLGRYLDPAGPTKGELSFNDKTPESIVMIQCVGSREKEQNSYCSRLCCMMALKHATLIKKRYPNTKITICYIDIRTTGEGYEDWYDRARDLEVIFMHGKASEVLEKNGKLIVRTEDVMLGEAVELKTDLVVLSAGIESSQETREMAGLLGLELNKDNFIKSLDPKVRGLDTAKWGIFICGGSRGPTDIPESILQANAASSKVSSLLARDKIVNTRVYPIVDNELCDGCEVCQVKCGFSAIEVDKEEKKAKLNRSSCHGCGVCAANCPNNAVQLLNYEDEAIFAEVEGILRTNGDGKKIVGFICSECGYASSDLAGVERFNYPESIHFIDLPCLGRISAIHILKAFEQGAAGVVLVGCMPGRCQYNSGNSPKDNIALAKEVLKKVKLNEKVKLYNFCGAKSHEFAKAMNDFATIVASN
ncbi:MAG: hydrogenase iron-sulfur subunit [bacterium]|nr:hydrogenase iron-sulfur subunit [bacterium]